MAKILVIGVGNSQKKVVEKLHEVIPESRCVLIGSYLYSENPQNIEYYNLLRNSKIAKEISSTYMPGSAYVMTLRRLPEIIEEQREKLEEFLGLNTIRKD